MKQIFTLFICLVGLSLNAQQSRYGAAIDEVPHQLKAITAKTQLLTDKAYNDTLFFEDFNGGMPGWVTVDNTSSGMNWIWDTAAPGGMFSTVIPRLQSTSGSNGFISLPLDRYNSPLPPTPQTADSYIYSPAIPIQSRGTVLIRFQHALRYCCSGSNRLELSVSSDSINWVSYDGTFGNNPSTAIANATSAEINISQAAANQDTIFLRFSVVGASHYFWMIDDIAIVEGADDHLIVRDHEIWIENIYAFKPRFRSIPKAMFSPSTLWASAFNDGGRTQLNTALWVNSEHRTYPNGAAGIGPYYIDSTSSVNSAVQSLDTFIVPRPANLDTLTGDIRVEFFINSIYPNQVPGSNHAIVDLSITDTVYARDSGGPFNASTGNDAFAGGGNDGDQVGSMYTLTDSAEVTSISYYVFHDSTSIGVDIRPMIWSFDQARPTLATAITAVDSGNTYTVSVSDLGTWITLPLRTAKLAPGQYIVGWHQISGESQSKTFSVGRFFEERDPPAVTNFIYINDATPSWGWINHVPAIRMNLGNLPIGGGSVGLEDLTEQADALRIFPNPVADELTLTMEGATQALNLRLMDINGRQLMDRMVFVNQDREVLNVDEFTKGVYLLQLTTPNGEIVKTEKLIIQ